MNKKEFFKDRIDKIAKESFNAEQKEIAKKIIDNTNEEDLDAVWGLISQRVKTGFVFDEAPEINHNCVAYIKENEKLGVNLDKKDVLEHALIIGENYDALKNLIATYTDKQGKGMIDVIYIDPPYNIEKSKDDGNDYKEEVQSNTFIYRDKYTRDGWLNMMNERLKLARKLLSEKGFIFISIDDNEHAYLKVLCDNIFGEEKFLTTIAWEKRTKCQNTETAKKMLQPKIEYVLVYKNFEKRAEFNCHIVGEKDYPQSDESGKYRIEEIGQMSSNGMRGRNTMIFSILGIEPKNGFQWKIGKETADRYINRNDIIIKGNKVYRKIRPFDESVENIKPFWAFMGAEQFGTAESAKEELSCILGTKEHGFETVKPVAMIKELLFQSTKDDSIILDLTIHDFRGGESTVLHF